MNYDTLVATFWRRFIFASFIWFIAWPTIWYFKLGEITGHKAWFWIIGELNYPVIAVIYFLLDGMVASFVKKPTFVFITTISIIAGLMPLYYARIGFALGVSLEARLF